MAVDEVSSEPFSGPNSLLTGKFHREICRIRTASLPTASCMMLKHASSHHSIPIFEPYRTGNYHLRIREYHFPDTGLLDHPKHGCYLLGRL